MQFYKMHIFPYSIRKGTKAEKMEDQIPAEIKEARSKELLALSNQNEKAYLESMIGKAIRVLWEERDTDGFYKGHTANYMMAKIQYQENLVNQLTEVTVMKQEDLILICH